MHHLALRAVISNLEGCVAKSRDLPLLHRHPRTIVLLVRYLPSRRPQILTTPRSQPPVTSSGATLTIPSSSSIPPSADSESRGFASSY